MNEHFITVARTARYYTLGDISAREIWIVCHGYAQLARYFLRQFQPIDDGSRLIVAPEALNRYYFDTAPGVHGPDARIGATWMTREDREHEIDDYSAYLDAVLERVAGDVEPAMVIALGFSQGAATVSRWAARSRARIDQVILWAGSMAHDAELAPWRGRALTVAIGSDDAQIPEERVVAEDSRLRDAGVAYQLYRYDGGHRVEAAALRTLADRLRSAS